MNIGLFTDCYYPQINGVTVSTVTLKEALEKLGHTVYVITVTAPGHKDIDKHVIRVPSVPFPKWKEFRVGLVYPPTTLKKIRDLKLDIIHTQTEFGICLMGRFIAKVLGIPVVHTYHTLYEHYTHYLSKYFLTENFAARFAIKGSKLYVDRCKAVIAPSKKTKEMLTGYGVKCPIEIIPSGIKLNNFDKDLNQSNYIREKLNLTQDDFVILSLGRISEEKSLDVIVNEFAQVKSNMPNSKLVIVGDGPYRNKLEAIKRESLYANDIIFTGQVPWDETGDYYNMADLFVSASKTETQGLTIYESLASGTPTIVRKDDNVLSHIKHFEHGLVFDQEKELNGFIRTVYDDAGLRNRLVANGKEMVGELSAEKFGEKVYSLYEKVVSNRKA